MVMRLNYEILCYFMMKDRILVMETNNLYTKVTPDQYKYATELQDSCQYCGSAKCKVCLKTV